MALPLARTVEFSTPKGYTLYGLWYGPIKPKRVLVFVHGLTSSVFSRVPRTIMPLLADKRTAVLVFNNRGHNVVARVSGKKKTLLAGAAHEVFTDCIDDISGAVRFARRTGSKNIYLAGHSTGCQKAVYYAAKTGKKAGVRGLVLLAPVSDHAAALKTDKNGTLRKALAYAQKMMRAGKKHELLPREFQTKWSMDDAQRFISLYTPDSIETIFPYEQKEKLPRALRMVKVPALVVWAEKDEYADRPAREIAEWFLMHTLAPASVKIIAKVKHGFKGAEWAVAATIAQFMRM